MTEDGETYTAECYYVVIEKDGVRFAHDKIFFGCETSIDEEYGVIFFKDTRDQALSDVNKLQRKIRNSNKINRDHWIEIEPSYGSEAYCKKFGF